jgi:uncharacterized protein YxeA
MKRVLKILGYILVIAFIVMQFFRPEMNDGGYDSFNVFEKETKVSDEVLSILKKNCFDCHTNQTRYTWYAEVAPISYWLNNHILDGKKHFNMSEWNGYSVKKKSKKMDELIEEVQEGEMPLNSYTWIHGSITEGEKEILIQWATMAILNYDKALKVSINQ